MTVERTLLESVSNAVKDTLPNSLRAVDISGNLLVPSAASWGLSILRARNYVCERIPGRVRDTRHYRGCRYYHHRVKDIPNPPDHLASLWTGDVPHVWALAWLDLLIVRPW
jgi:hypothetical protein